MAYCFLSVCLHATRFNIGSLHLFQDHRVSQLHIYLIFYVHLAKEQNVFNYSLFNIMKLFVCYHCLLIIFARSLRIQIKPDNMYSLQSDLNYLTLMSVLLDFFLKEYIYIGEKLASHFFLKNAQRLL